MYGLFWVNWCMILGGELCMFCILAYGYGSSTIYLKDCCSFLYIELQDFAFL